MSARRSKVIGYFAYASLAEVACTGDACVISGSRRAMEEYILEIDPGRRKMRTIKKTTFDEIKKGLLLGAAYAFDKVSYGRFYPLARRAGLDVMKADFEKHEAEGFRFFTVQLKSP
ncbi:MAG: hypothetical protein U9R15_05515 [Chloroflexota bacterium]|nr:hypothetical protein [Chloroflexota bacterium]